MGISYSTAAGFGIMFTGDEIEQFVKDRNIQTDDDYCWECAEAVSREYNLKFAHAGNSLTGDEMYFLFGAVRMLDEYNDDEFRFHEIEAMSIDDAAAILRLQKDSGKKPASYVGMHVG